VTQRGLTVFTTINIIQFISNPLYFIENLLINMFNTMDIFECWLFSKFLGIMRLEGRFGPNPCTQPCWGFLPSNPSETLTLTLQNPLPLAEGKGTEG